MLKLFAVVAVFSLILVACGSATSDSPLKTGGKTYGSTCSVCHGQAGQGGVGPAFADVVQTFPSCDDQIEWITLGSDNWKRTYGETYGAIDRPVEGGMPSHAESLTPQEIAAVAAWERATYGGVSEQVAIGQCGVEIVDE